MEAMPLTQLWMTFNPEMRLQMTYLWTDLLWRQLHDHRLLEKEGEADECHPENSGTTSKPASTNLCPAIHPQTSTDSTRKAPGGSMSWPKKPINLAGPCPSSK